MKAFHFLEEGHGHEAKQKIPLAWQKLAVSLDMPVRCTPKRTLVYSLHPWFVRNVPEGSHNLTAILVQIVWNMSHLLQQNDGATSGLIIDTCMS